jgi:adenine-specific DNA-methyltransferase
MTKLKETLIDILKEDQRLFDDQGEVKENLLRELIDQYDPQLIELLLNHEITRQKFFVSAGKAMVFKGTDFKFFIDENKLDNSYTQFENKIGLKVGSRLLREYRYVVLNFPYKDCVLEGGQSTEEGTDTYFEYNKESGDYDEKKAKRKEIFFNQILAKDEIDRLFEPKAFSKVLKYQKDENGSIIESEAKEFTRDENGDIKDNLIIKGNNLLALHSLKEQFRGKVNLIYIDPPYNTGKDSFAYNDNFNHSSWMVFVKNRLEIAKSLLTPEGLIFISCDDSEQPYLKVLSDEVFNRENFIACLPTIMNLKGNNDQFGFAGCHEYTLVYSKNRNLCKINEFDIDEEGTESWSIDSIGYFKKGAPLRATGDESLREDRTKMFYPILVDIEKQEVKTVDSDEFEKIYSFENEEFDDNFVEELRIKYESLGLKFILPIADKNNFGRWRWGYNETNKEKLKTDVLITETKNSISLYKKQRPELGELPSRKPKSIFYKPEYSSGNGTAQLKSFFGDKVFKNPKPVELIKDFIKIGCHQSGLILDFHAGSGTTAHAVLELNKEDGGNRQFILVEQMDYAESITSKRVQKVIEKENIDASFLYLELAKNNQNALKRIEAAGSYEELITFFDEMYERYFLNYNVKIREFKEKVSQEPSFKNLTLDRQKQIFGKMLDLNQLYVNRSDMEDSRFQLSENDIAATHNFYGKNPTFL